MGGREIKIFSEILIADARSRTIGILICGVTKLSPRLQIYGAYVGHPLIGQPMSTTVARVNITLFLYLFSYSATNRLPCFHKEVGIVNCVFALNNTLRTSHFFSHSPLIVSIAVFKFKTRGFPAFLIAS